MEPLYRSNEFCSMVGTTRNTLRYYMESGLLSPALVNENGYTFYGEMEALQMMMLQLHRSCNLSVDGVKEFMWTMNLPTQSQGLDAALEDLDEQIQRLQKRRYSLARRCEAIHKCLNHLNQPIFDDVEVQPGREMYILNLHETIERMGAEGIALIREMTHRMPQTHISLEADWRDFVARRDMPVKLGYGVVKRDRDDMGMQGLDISLFHRIPAHRCVVVRVRVKDPLFLKPQDLQPLYDEVERRNCKVVDGVFGHLLSMESENGTFYYYIAMRVHVE